MRILTFPSTALLPTRRYGNLDSLLAMPLPEIRTNFSLDKFAYSFWCYIDSVFKAIESPCNPSLTRYPNPWVVRYRLSNLHKSAQADDRFRCHASCGDHDTAGLTPPTFIVFGREVEHRFLSEAGCLLSEAGFMARPINDWIYRF